MEQYTDVRRAIQVRSGSYRLLVDDAGEGAVPAQVLATATIDEPRYPSPLRQRFTLGYWPRMGSLARQFG